MPKSVFKRSIALLLAAALVSGGVLGDAAGNTESGKAAAAGVSEYTEYTAENAAVPNAESDIETALENAQGSLGAEFLYKNPLFKAFIHNRNLYKINSFIFKCICIKFYIEIHNTFYCSCIIC